MKVKPYNRASAVEYARKWAYDRNREYYDFQNIGGDCTNFASQCIYAGAEVMNFTKIFGWYYRSISDRTASWSGVEYLYNFLINNKSTGPYGREVKETEIEPGDIVQLGNLSGKFYHSPVILATSPIILVAAHTDDALDRPLYWYNYEVARFIHIDGVRTR